MNEHHLNQLLERADYFTEHNMWLHASQYYLRVLAENPGAVDIASKLAHVYASMGNLEAAEKTMLNILSSEPDNPDVLYTLGMIFFRTQQFERATYYLERLIPARIPHAHYILGLIHFQKADSIGAERHLRKTLELNPDFPNAVQTLVEVLLKTRQPLKAIPLLEGQLEKDPKDWKLRQLLGTAMMMDEQWDRAYSQFHELLNDRPDDVEILAATAEVCLHVNRVHEASELLIQARELDPASADILVALGNVALRQAEKTKAEKYFTLALQLDPTHPEAVKSIRLLDPLKG